MYINTGRKRQLERVEAKQTRGGKLYQKFGTLSSSKGSRQSSCSGRARQGRHFYERIMLRASRDVIFLHHARVLTCGYRYF